MAESSRFLLACRLPPAVCAPIRIMRQAGRCPPEYPWIRREDGLLEISRTPGLACEVVLHPLRRFHMDAAVLSSGILIPDAARGVACDTMEESGASLRGAGSPGRGLWTNAHWCEERSSGGSE